MAADAERAVGGADDQDGHARRDLAAAQNDVLKHHGITLLVPAAVTGLIGAVVQHDERGRTVAHQRLLNGGVPAQEDGRLRAVDAHGLIGDAAGVLGDEAEQADGSAREGADLEVVLTRRDGGGGDGRR